MALAALALSVASAQIAKTSAKSYAHPTHRSNRYVITDFGAVGDGKTLNTKAIQAAIDKCASTKKGGVLVIPKGTFLSGAIFLKQGVNLLLEKDGVLKGSRDPDDYPQVQTRWEGTEEMWTSAFVNAFNVTGLIISGEGTIDGSGENWGQNRPPAPPSASTDATAAALAPAPPPPPPAAASPAAPRQYRGRPRLVAIQNAKDVLVTGVTLEHQAVWCLFILYSQNVEVEGVTIRGDHSTPSADGMDIDSSRHVHVNRVDIDTNDDCLSIKSGKDADGLRVNRPAEDILIENSHFGNGGSGVDMGSETSGGIRNVVIQNCVMDNNNSAPIRFKSAPSRGGLVENITYRNLVLHQTRQFIEMNLNWSNRAMARLPPVPPANPLPSFRNVKIINVSGDVQTAGTINGLPDSPIQGVTFQNCHITANIGLRISHARDIDLSGLTLDVKQGEAITKTDVQ
ncbi:MAG: glycoside hydrolase family 28 protein [Acidobacteriaceae bacterium]